MKNILLLFSFSVLFLLPYSLLAQTNSCMDCHRELGDEHRAIVEAFQQDVHRQFGLGCEDCHGGNPDQEDVDLAKDHTFKGKPERSQIPEFCGSCHSDGNYMKRFNPSVRVDQLSLYWTSLHGQKLQKGDTHVAVCTDCHGVHGIRAGSHPKAWTFPWNIPGTCGRCHSDKNLMKSYKIPAGQEDDYRESVHARALFEQKDLSAPVCNDCHGNHGAIPPEVTSIAQVCRQCHPSAGKLFSESPHKEAFDEMGISECEACHGNHRILPPSDKMLGTGDEAVCIQCHEEDSPSYNTAAKIRQRIQSLSEKIHGAEDLLSQAYEKGVEVSEQRFRLKEINTTLVMIRDLTHSLSLDSIDEKAREADEGITGIIKEGKEALREASLRRTGLVIATFFVIILAIALFLKIRQMKGKGAS